MDIASCKKYDTVDVVRRHNFSLAGQLRPGRCDIAEIYEHSRKDNEKEIQHYLYQECFTIVSVTP